MGKKSKSKRRERARKAQEPELNKKPLLVAVVLAVLGLLLSLYATYLTFKIARGGMVEASGCSINDWINCDLAHASSYARLLGIPVAWWGALFYAFAGLAALNGAFSPGKARASAYLVVSWLLTIGGCLFSLYKAANLVELRVLCPVCVGMYLMNFGLLFAIPAGLSLRVGEWGSYLSRYFKNLGGGDDSELLFAPKPLLMSITVLVFFGVGYAAINNYENRIMDTSGFNVEQAVATHFRQQPLPLDVGDGPALWGNPDAKVVVVEFADFQCPGCAQAASRLRPMLWEFRNDIQFRFVNYPLDSRINQYMASQLHANAGDAARAAVCSQQFGDFWEYHDEMFENQISLGMSLFTRMAEERGWDVDAFTDCMASDATTERIKSDIELGRSIGLRSTPTVMVNGRFLTYWAVPQFTQAVLREEIAGSAGS